MSIPKAIVTIIKANLVPTLVVAEDVLGPGPDVALGHELGLELGADEDEDGRTVITSFWFPTSQCWPTPQMYHFLPGVARLITSFPLVNGTLSNGAAHC